MQMPIVGKPRLSAHFSKGRNVRVPALLFLELIAEFIGVVAAAIAFPGRFRVARPNADQRVAVAFGAALGIGGFGIDIIFKEAEDPDCGIDGAFIAIRNERSLLFKNSFFVESVFSAATASQALSQC